MPKEEIYEILAALAADQPGIASEKFKAALDARTEDAIKDYVRNAKLTTKTVDEEQPEAPTDVVDGTPQDKGPSQSDVDAARAKEMQAWRDAQNPTEKGAEDGLTDDHKVAID